ncbi:hypothetical protein ASPFODRAFT_51808 [Aspergillus luchuensis CBS 106.47]|uniref:Uncharacterized protein n=1 Tax=Aspergillus luchuensis (strain CBS 106.47) TaxID=1137211 RepID=A0A1M3T3V0_ASPLC|nr:hypothetical protein ASPFODRAFT_51808 [Aspergillus luchuensis CBS 106.47]
MAQLTLSWFVHAHEETQSRGQPYVGHIAHPRASEVRSGSGSASHSFPSTASPISRLLISGDFPSGAGQVKG